MGDTFYKKFIKCLSKHFNYVINKLSVKLITLVHIILNSYLFFLDSRIWKNGKINNKIIYELSYVLTGNLTFSKTIL